MKGFAAEDTSAPKYLISQLLYSIEHDAGDLDFLFNYPLVARCKSAFSVTREYWENNTGCILGQRQSL